MKTVLTMECEGIYRTFQILEDGSARENNTKIDDFGSYFEMLSNIGWKTVAETNIAIDHKEKSNIISFPEDRPTFRDQWEEYLSEYSDNLEVEFV